MSIDSNYTDAYFNRAVCQQKLNNYELSIADFKIVYDLDSLDLMLFLSKRFMQWKTIILKNLKNCSSDLVLFPSHTKSAYELGVLHYLQKDFKSAITAFTKCLALDDKNAYAFHDRGSCYRLIEDFDKAEKDYLSAIELDPKSFMYNNLGAIYKLKGMYAKAQQAFNEAIGIDLSNLFPTIIEVVYILNKKITRMPLKILIKHLHLNPHYILALCNRAAIHHLREQYGAALADLNKAFELDKLNPSILLNRGITKEMLRDEGSL